MNEIRETKNELLFDMGKNTIWFTRHKDGTVNIGLNMRSHASVSGRWDFEITTSYQKRLELFMAKNYDPE